MAQHGVQRRIHHLRRGAGDADPVQIVVSRMAAVLVSHSPAPRNKRGHEEQGNDRHLAPGARLSAGEGCAPVFAAMLSMARNRMGMPSRRIPLPRRRNRHRSTVSADDVQADAGGVDLEFVATQVVYPLARAEVEATVEFERCRQRPIGLNFTYIGHASRIRNTCRLP